jgi:hypothetical protein
MTVTAGVPANSFGQGVTLVILQSDSEQ